MRKFADLEREAFQCVIDEMAQDMTNKEDLVTNLNEKVAYLLSEQVRSTGLHPS